MPVAASPRGSCDIARRPQLNPRAVRLVISLVSLCPCKQLVSAQFGLGTAPSGGGGLGLGGLGGGLGSGGFGGSGLGGTGLGGGFAGGIGGSSGGLGGLNNVGGSPVGGAASGTLHKGFEYSDVAAFLLERPSPRSVTECRETCTANTTCAAWEVCAPLGDGCEGCYLIKRAPKQFTDRPGWNAEVIAGREEQGWGDDGLEAFGNMTAAGCKEFLLNANGADQATPFHEPAIMQRYVACGFILRDAELPRDIVINGQHYPTFTVTNFWDPPVILPRDVEQEMLATSNRQPRRQMPTRLGQTQGIDRQLHASVGTTTWEDHLTMNPRGPHAFVIPFFDTNIGHWVKQHGSMNPMQSYEMQSLLQAGDVVIDVGANLGCYTVPFGGRVGPRGKVLAFEPFRLLHQVVSSNVAINGLSNVWVLPVGLSTEFSRFEAHPPQLKFFSSPGGMKLRNQQDDMKPEQAMQLLDFDAGPELITVVSLDDILQTRSVHTAVLGVPPVDDVRLIKIDVEGMEKEVIAGARQTILQYRPIIWTENVAYFSSKGQDTSLLQLLDQLEYTCAQAQNAPNDIVCTDRHGRGHQVMA
eukprot:TRINITY_DN10214_c0_g1_i1.p1 TRINITY_DN10214_c0_g1~~TRINITY_DN10214_c0_g1_i1.p1  ORF type:complete len:614 (-),score=84.05 TRINITY_DN10214_c0_g1_i1:141-1886(-)